VRTNKTFRYRIYPTPAQIARLSRWSDALRFLWNLALEQRKLGYGRARDERIYPTAFNQINELTELRAALPWLADVPRGVSSNRLFDLDKAWQRCFARISRAPRFKRRGRDTVSMTESSPKQWRIDGTFVRFPKLGNLRAVLYRPFEGRPKTCTLTRDGNQWFVNIVCELEIAPVQRTVPEIAIDRGIHNFIAGSNGQRIQNPRYLKASQKQLARAQRIFARRKKGSKNREKAGLRVTRIHQKIRRRRNHFLHVQSARLAKSHGVVVIEKLNVAAMMLGKRGGAGGNIRDAGWSRFAMFLRYKLTWSGGSLVEVPAAYSSQTCSACGTVDAKSRVEQAVFCCTSCGHKDHADVNAAKVLLQRFKTPGNPWCLPVDGSARKGPGRSRKRVVLRVPRRSPEGTANN
jgi:putative transposase